MLKKLFHWSFCFGLLVVAANSVAFGQTIPRDVYSTTETDATGQAGTLVDDVLAGRTDGRVDVPALSSDITIPDVQFVFDQLLDKDRISVINNLVVSSKDQSFLTDTRLSAGARSILLNHMAAIQQVELAIRFLQANRSDILAGKSAAFTQVFGTIGTQKDFAIIAPDPIPGVATLTQPAANAVNQFTTITFQQAGGGGGNNATGANPSALNSKLRAGDYIYLVQQTNFRPSGASSTPVAVTANAGVVLRVFAVLSGGGGQGNNAANQQTLVLDPNMAPIAPTTFGAGANNLQVYKVLRFEKRVDQTRYEEVLATFQSIKKVLVGLNPDLPTLGQTPNIIRYNRAFTDINSLWQPGVAQLATLDPVISNFMSTGVTGLTTNRGADRLVRQAGFSTSDSHSHLDRLEDRSANILADRNGNPTLPLLWTEDNNLPDVFDDPASPQRRRVDLTKLDADRAFFRDRQTIFGEPDNPFTQYLGRAFFEETIQHSASFFEDKTIAITNTLTQLDRRLRNPAGGALQTTAVQTGNGVVQVPQIEPNANVPESGNPTKKNTEFRRWQMIIESFAEFRTDLTRFDSAAIGVRDILGGFAPGDLAAKDAGNFARFAGLLGGSATNSIDISRIEPLGKRAEGGFNPVVPRN